LNRAIRHYYERAKERMEHANANDQRHHQKETKSGIGMNLAGIYSEGGESLHIDGTLNIAAVTTPQ